MREAGVRGLLFMAEEETPKRKARKMGLLWLHPTLAMC